LLLVGGVEKELDDLIGADGGRDEDEEEVEEVGIGLDDVGDAMKVESSLG